MANALLLTGVPGVGKTTAIREILAGLPPKGVRGFLTEEIREGGRRTGFRIESLAGESATMAHVSFRSTHRVGRYGVDLEVVDRMTESELQLDASTRLWVVDEIGKMECFSRRFVEAMEGLLDSGRPLVATVALRGGGFIAEVKRRPDVDLREITRANRDRVPAEVLAFLDRRGGAPSTARS